MIPLFYPETKYWKESIDSLKGVLQSRWWGQADLVDKFEDDFSEKFNYRYCLALNSGTAALELAYHLIGIEQDDEVITTVLTCTATNLPLIRRGAKIIFADISKKDLLINPKDLESKITNNTKAIIVVTLGGLPIDKKVFDIAKKNNIPVVIDAAQSLGVPEQYGDYIAYSFQAIKHFSTGDGGMLVVREKGNYERAKALRWFGIDRDQKKKANWQAYKNREMTIDIEEAGYKFHMNDINASLGIIGLNHSDEILNRRREIALLYDDNLKNCKKISGGSYWLYCVLINNRDNVAKELLKSGIEVNLIHLRNDIYKVFKIYNNLLPNMKFVEDKYLYLPMNTYLSDNQIKKVISIFNKVIDS